MIASGVLYWTIVALAVAVYAGTNVCFFSTIRPRRKPGLRKLWWTLVGHALPQAAALLSLLLLLQMPAAVLMLLSTVLLLALLANNKKYSLLNEPLLPSDVAMTMRQLRVWRILGQYVRHDLRVAVVLPAALAATILVLAREPWLAGRYFFCLGLLSPIPASMFWPPRGRSPLVRLFEAAGIPFYDWDLRKTVATGGFFPTFLRSMDNIPRPAVRSMTAYAAETVLDETFGHSVPIGRPDRLPHIVVVLAEGFIDPRTMGIVVEPHPLTNYDAAVARGVYSGRAWVPVYGGWTVRSEYSLLTGISLTAFANNIGNPNATLVSPGTHSLPKHLRSFGYRTLLVHPYDARFYGRDRAAASLGFDDFLDERCFAGAPREEGFVSDPAVAARIEEELRRATQPTFLFCITVENHGPWDDTTLPPMAPFTTRPSLSPANHLAFSHYLHHLRSMDQMIRQLTDIVATSRRPTIVLLVGDHFPSLTGLFREVGAPNIADGAEWSAAAPYFQTPYFLLSSEPAERRQMNCDISFLPGLVLECAGLNGDRFFHHNGAMRRYQNGNIHDKYDSVVRQAYLRYCYEMAAFPERHARAA